MYYTNNEYFNRWEFIRPKAVLDYFIGYTRVQNFKTRSGPAKTGPCTAPRVSVLYTLYILLYTAVYGIAQ